jgi:DtxR family transcriptional regulator, iron-dependent repressor
MLSEAGRTLATRVTRKHRLAECFLSSLIGLPAQEAHDEACQWEHVISEAVERRLLELLGHPDRCPHGNPIPGLGELVAGSDHEQRPQDQRPAGPLQAPAGQEDPNRQGLSPATVT